MIVAASIPPSFIRRAHHHLRRTGRPLVYARRRMDRELMARRNPASGRWVLYALPEPLEGRFSFAELLVRLTVCARMAVEGIPRVFQRDGYEIGRVDVCDGMVLVSSALALSCLSYVLRHHEPRTGFYLRVLGRD